MKESFRAPIADTEPVPEHVQERARSVLNNLGIDAHHVHHLKGADVLDVGALEADVVRFLRSHGVNATPLDINDEAADSIEGYVVGDAFALPFEDASFDMVLAHANPAFMSDTPSAFREALRITRDNGEVRVGPFFSPSDKTETTNVALQEYTALHADFPEIVMSPPIPSRTQGYNQHYFVLKNRPPKKEEV